LKNDYPVVTRDEVFNVIHKCHLRTESTCTLVRNPKEIMGFPAMGFFRGFRVKLVVHASMYKPTRGKRIPA
jgi:hypothetical protein